jgi:hypothetical protein
MNNGRPEQYSQPHPAVDIISVPVACMRIRVNLSYSYGARVKQMKPIVDQSAMYRGPRAAYFKYIRALSLSLSLCVCVCVCACVLY